MSRTTFAFHSLHALCLAISRHNYSARSGAVIHTNRRTRSQTRATLWISSGWRRAGASPRCRSRSCRRCALLRTRGSRSRGASKCARRDLRKRNRRVGHLMVLSVRACSHRRTVRTSLQQNCFLCRGCSNVARFLSHGAIVWRSAQGCPSPPFRTQDFPFVYKPMH